MLTNEMRQQLKRRMWDALVLFGVPFLFGLLMAPYILRSVVDITGVALGVLIGGAFAYSMLPVRIVTVYLSDDELVVEEKLDELLSSQDRRSVWFIVTALELTCCIIAVPLVLNGRWFSENSILSIIWTLCFYALINQGYWLCVYIHVFRTYSND